MPKSARFQLSQALLLVLLVGCEGNIDGPLAWSGTGNSSGAKLPSSGGSVSVAGAPAMGSSGLPGTGGVGGSTSAGIAGSSGNASGGAENPCGTAQLLCGTTCVSPLTDATHCGNCTTVCQAGQVCQNGQCACSAGLSPCPGGCLDLTSNASNCGNCGAPCEGAEVCALGQCSLECPDQLTQCGQSCVDLTSSVVHCGGCDQPCSSGWICDSGDCACPDGLDACGSSCFDFQNDDSHCGGCNTVCSGGQQCESGSCQCPSGTFCAGQCRDMQSDAQNCGTCGNACASASCTGGTCDPVPTDNGLVGWATVNGTTTGGSGGSTVDVDTASELVNAAKSSTKQVIRISGTLSVASLVVASNKTLVGVNGSATIVGGIEINGRTNVIIQNLKVNAKSSGVNGDGIRITNSNHVWIDHCEVWDAPDGNLDISEASNYITISWTKFWYSNSPGDDAHRFSNLIGGSDTATGDSGKLKITWHHNWWAARVHERMPRVRFGEVHVFNNYYSSSGNNYAIRAGYQARVRVENNYFDGVKNPHEVNEDSGTGLITASGNTYDGTSGSKTSNGTVFTPPYTYKLDAASAIPAAVQAGAGPH